MDSSSRVTLAKVFVVTAFITTIVLLARCHKPLKPQDKPEFLLSRIMDGLSQSDTFFEVLQKPINELDWNGLLSVKNLYHRADIGLEKAIDLLNGFGDSRNEKIRTAAEEGKKSLGGIRDFYHQAAEKIDLVQASGMSMTELAAWAEPMEKQREQNWALFEQNTVDPALSMLILDSSTTPPLVRMSPMAKKQMETLIYSLVAEQGATLTVHPWKLIAKIYKALNGKDHPAFSQMN